ncbi:LacI family DNA-binding transcriptional regulator [Rariglobus hedericola]|nr:LacI family DNA-binding transcriptional regulator [Rariglobus hedericola]
MKEVAAAAGVSAATVSRALGMDPQIPVETRERIQKIAAQLGYRPDPLLSAFARRRRGNTLGSDITTLAYITNFQTSDEWTRNPFYAPMFKGAADQALRNGYKLEHFWLREPGMTGERLSRILHNRGIAGLVVAPTPIARSRLSMDWAKFSCVTIGYSLLRPDLHRTTPHHFHAILIASRKLWRLGYTRIGLCLYASTSPRVDDLWLAGALLTQKHNPAAALKVFLFDDDTRARIPEWARAERLEVVLSDNTQALHELRRGGIRAPGEIDFATLNWSKTECEIAGIDQRPDSIGAAAIDLLIAQIQRDERGIPAMPITSMVEGTWINGPSLSKKARQA